MSDPTAGMDVAIALSKTRISAAADLKEAGNMGITTKERPAKQKVDKINSSAVMTQVNKTDKINFFKINGKKAIRFLPVPQVSADTPDIGSQGIEPFVYTFVSPVDLVDVVNKTCASGRKCRNK